MRQNREEVLIQAMALPPDDRALLADKLLNSLDSPRKEEINFLWAEEAERRLQQIISGEVEPIPGDEVFREIRRTFIP
jgi:putative addiction module component (TIGR02574 family)